MILKVLLIEGMQQSVTGTIRRRRGARRLLAAKIFRLSAERALINFSVFQAGKRQAHMLQFQNRFRPRFTHVFNGILVTDIIGAFYRVVHMPFPVILMSITQRDGNPSLRRDRMRPGGKNFGQQGAGLARLGNLQRGAHTCTTGANNNSIKLSDWQIHYTPHTTTNP